MDFRNTVETLKPLLRPVAATCFIVIGILFLLISALGTFVEYGFRSSGMNPHGHSVQTAIFNIVSLAMIGIVWIIAGIVISRGRIKLGLIIAGVTAAALLLSSLFVG